MPITNSRGCYSKAMSHPETSSLLLRLSHFGVKGFSKLYLNSNIPRMTADTWYLINIWQMFRPWFLVFLKTIIFDLVKISKTLTLWNRRDTNVTLRLLKNSGPSITFLRLSSESDWDHIIYQDSKLLAHVVYFAEADWTTLGCQINESTRLAFTHFFHPTRLANFPSYLFIRHYFLEFY